MDSHFDGLMTFRKYSRGKSPYYPHSVPILRYPNEVMRFRQYHSFWRKDHCKVLKALSLEFMSLLKDDRWHHNVQIFAHKSILSKCQLFFKKWTFSSRESKDCLGWFWAFLWIFYGFF